MAKKKAEQAKMLKITLVKSANNSIQKHKATVAALGLRKIGQTVEQKDNEKIRGMIQKVRHLVSVEE
ncbi:MAG TPA: 50S ribosomal protein L30 [Clostridia bacterium]|jgi:large subunit ribosomal protein L30|nr:50S ribosomal protein L30 [Clostridia bacterium]HOT69844.1 50S ribosomal protein L30 [Clostridia bacterium]HQF99570.1 50S ribosomal protein L30 [Clostridia bacterium]HQH64636.1 50S ribosomal protein L30 [Clostridia bacterium]HQJ91997.1 50S ribosomal protein L30 [Clostridia bacterium]